jgi:hypothetical protein
MEVFMFVISLPCRPFFHWRDATVACWSHLQSVMSLLQPERLRCDGDWTCRQLICISYTTTELYFFLLRYRCMVTLSSLDILSATDWKPVALMWENQIAWSPRNRRDLNVFDFFLGRIADASPQSEKGVRLQKLVTTAETLCWILSIVWGTRRFGSWL